MTKRYRLLPVVLAFAGFAAACSSEYTRADFIAEATEGEDGFTQAQAECSADGLEAAGIEFDVLDVAADDIDPAVAEEVTGILFDCALNS